MKRLALLALVLAAACGSDKSATEPTTVTFAGTFNLRTVNGANLPYVLLQSGQSSVTVTNDVITIADGGTWSETGSFQVKQNGQTANQTQSDNGTWLRSGNSIVLHSNVYNNTAYSGTFTNSQLTLSDDIPLNYVFAK